MSRLGLKFSKANAESKPSFNSAREAEQHYFKWLNNAKKSLSSLAKKTLWIQSQLYFGKYKRNWATLFWFVGKKEI